MIIVETTFNKKEDAESIVSFLLEEKLIACATYKNVESSYVWKGTIENEKEIEVSLHVPIFGSHLFFLKLKFHTYDLAQISLFFD